MNCPMCGYPWNHEQRVEAMEKLGHCGGSSRHAGGAMTFRRVRLLIEVEATTDRDAWEWGDGVARYIRAAFDDEPDAAVMAECVDAEEVPESRPAGEDQA